MSTQQLPLVSVEEYLEFERKSECRNEYVFGEIVGMAGGTPRHGQITGNAIIAVGKRLLETGCRLFDSSPRICADREILYPYPDVTIACGPLQYTDERRDTISNPTIVIEVLSPSTRNYDIGDKARMYTRIPSLPELLLIEEDKVWIEHWRRLPNGHWDIETVADPSATLKMDSIGCAVPVAEIYDRVELSEG